VIVISVLILWTRRPNHTLSPHQVNTQWTQSALVTGFRPNLSPTESTESRQLVSEFTHLSLKRGE
jgi:hypothetical protein